jgi:LPS export ABC transporter protein LptC
MNILQHKIYKNIALLFSFAIFFMLTSCEEDLTKVKGKPDNNFATQIIYNADIVERDSGIVTLRAKAPIIEKYELLNPSYIVASKGINIEFFDKKKPKTPGTLSANYAKIYETKKFYEAKGDVKIRTTENQRFAMQSVYWDQIERQIYTKDTVYITLEDGSTIVGNHGMKAKDDFSEYTLFKGKADFNAQKLKMADQ